MNNKYLKPLTLVIAFLILTLVTVASYAYFTATVNGNSNAQESVITTGYMEVTFEDGNLIGSTQNLTPGDYIIKNFTVTNTGTLDTFYDIYLNDVNNTFVTKSDLVYELTSEDGINIVETQCPDDDSKIASSIEIGVGQTHRYTLKITFKETNIVQDDNKDKLFSATINLKEKVKLAAGVYDMNDQLVYSWQQLLDEGLLTVENNKLISKANSWPNATTSAITGKLIIDDSIEAIGKNVFNYCDELKSVYIPKSVTSIDSSAFNDTSILEEIIVDDKNEIYDDGNNSNVIIETASDKLVLGSINNSIPDYVKIIGKGAYYGKAIETIDLPDELTTIENSAFFNSTISRIDFPTTLTTIGDYAFEYSKLTSLAIPSSITSIGKQAFAGAPINTISVNSTNSVYDSRNECNAIIKTATNELIQGSISANIPNGIKTIGNSAFYRLPISSISIPTSVTKIDDQAFYECTNLNNVVIPSSVTKIGNAVFMNNSSLSNITLNNGLLTIGNSVFSSCKALQSITIPNSVTTLGAAVFMGDNYLSEVVIGDKVTNINGGTFDNCSSLTRVTIGLAVKEIVPGVFNGASNLSYVLFKDPSNWYINGSSISSSNLANPSTAATYLKSTYLGAMWTKN